MRSNMFFGVGFLSVLALVAASLLERKPGVKLIPLVVGGDNVSIEEVPYQVLLELPNSKFCGGCILSGQWVITTAQCAFYAPNKIIVRAGTDNRLSGGSEHKVLSIIRHENHTVNEYNVPLNDVALVRVTTPFHLDRTRRPIQIFSKDEEVIESTDATITGWGSMAPGGSPSETLQKFVVPIVSKTNCDKFYQQSHGGLPPGQICAGLDEGGKGACDGDFGGPMTIAGRLAGLVSWSHDCALPQYPGVYTEIAYYNDWITNHTNL